MDFIFSTQISLSIAICLGIGAVGSLAYFFWLLNRHLKLRKASSQICTVSQNALPGVSVVIYSHNQDFYLEENLPHFMSQEYPAEFEVIVVDDASTDDTEILLTRLTSVYSNLRFTKVPNEARNVSRHKLALMLGIKSAKHDIVITTCANCRPAGANWLTEMASNFSDEKTELVIGHSVYDYTSVDSWSRHFWAFDYISAVAQYTAAAIGGKTFRGNRHNLAYRKSTFFANKGFAHSMNLHHGDDDIFIHEIARRNNAAVALSYESLMLEFHPSVSHALHDSKVNHSFTAKFLPMSAFFTTATMNVVFAASVVATIAAIALGYLNYFVLACASAILLFQWISITATFRGIATSLHMPRPLFSTWIFTLIRPIVNLRYRMLANASAHHQHTWQSISN